MDEQAVEAEMFRAEQELKSLIGEEIDTLSVKSLTSDDAPFLGQIVSKLSPMIGNLLEARIIQLLDENAGAGAHWERQDPGFPDAALVDSAGNHTGAGFEVKAWYVFSTELTGRFRESQNLLASRDVRVVIVAWAMSHIVHGVPQILDVLVTPAKQVAKSRDDHYHKPPGYLIVEPGDTTSRTRNLQQTNVNGYKLQISSGPSFEEAGRIAGAHPGYGKPPHLVEAQELAQFLMSTYPYRLDTNFAKVDRVDNPAIEELKSRVLHSQFRERSVSAWITLLRALNLPEATNRRHAEAVMRGLYDDL